MFTIESIWPGWCTQYGLQGLLGVNYKVCTVYTIHDSNWCVQCTLSGLYDAFTVHYWVYRVFSLHSIEYSKG